MNDGKFNEDDVNDSGQAMQQSLREATIYGMPTAFPIIKMSSMYF